MADTYSNIAVEKNEKESEVVITGEVTAEAAAKFRAKALRQINESANVPGFRKGHVPENVLVEKVGEAFIMEEAAEIALKEVAPEVIEKNAPDYIGRPRIEITKLAPGNPIGFKIAIAVSPTVKLPDYKKIASNAMAAKADSTEVTDKEIDDVIEEVRKQRAHHAFHKANADKKDDHSHSEADVEKFKPDFTDEFVKTLGAFESVADFRAKAKENMIKEKEHRNVEKKRGAMLEKLVEETDLKLPRILVEGELDRMASQFESDIAGMGLKTEDYLKHIKKTMEELRKDWEPDAVKRAKLNVVLVEIAKKEGLSPDKELLENEVKHIMNAYKDADEVRVRAYVEHSLTLETAIRFLESQT